jgi:dTDP-4-amino-4,6-dideoxygalactose transaminase
MDNADPALFADIMAAIERVATTGAFTGGPDVEAFESEWADYCESPNAIAVSSGTEALILTLRALGIGPGDEVIVPANSFVATAEAVSLAGATPRFVDVDPVTHALTADLAREALSPATAAIIAVHLYGRTADLDPIINLGRAHGVAVVEDACQAHGARYGGRRVGTIGVAGCFSFYPGKNLGAWGDGGAVVTPDSDLAARIRLLRSHGESPRYHHQLVGTTARLHALQAAVLRVKLPLLEGWNERRRSIGATMTAALEGAGVTTPAMVPAGHDHVYHQFVVGCDERDALRAYLAADGIASGIHYPVPIHRSGAYADLGYPPGSLPVSERLARRACSLPVFPSMTSDQLERIVRAVREFSATPSEEPLAA